MGPLDSMPLLSMSLEDICLPESFIWPMMFGGRKEAQGKEERKRGVGGKSSTFMDDSKLPFFECPTEVCVYAYMCMYVHTCVFRIMESAHS